MNIETEQLKLRLIESQMQVLQYQHRDVLITIQSLQAAKTQTEFDAAVDARDMPSGQTTPPDLLRGD